MASEKRPEGRKEKTTDCQNKNIIIKRSKNGKYNVQKE